MGYLVQQSAVVQCAHGGSAKPTVASPRVKLGGQPVVTQPKPWTITGCSQPPPNAGNGPCATASFTSASTRIRVMGEPVLLQESQATCTPTGTPLIITSTQTRVRGQ
jgi:hypothetical protein